jgi:hypothetical protein
MSRPGFSVALARCASRALTAALAVTLVITTVAVGLHHHDDGTPGHSCAICVASHTPAVAAPAATGSPAPRPLAGLVRTLRSRRAPQVRITATPSRAPPLA